MASPWTRKSTRAKPFGADRPVRVPGDLEDRGALAVGHLGTGRGLGQARRVLRGVVVELVAGHDLARTEQLDPGWVVAEDRDLEVASAGQVRLGEGERVVAERSLERGVDLGRRRGPASSRPSCRAGPA